MTKFTLNSVGFKAETRDMILEIKEKTMKEEFKEIAEMLEGVKTGEYIPETLDRTYESSNNKETIKLTLFRNIEETPKRWRAKIHKEYYCIDEFNKAICSKEDNLPMDNKRYEIGNYFQTIEQANKKIEHLKIEQQLKDIALRLNNGVEINFYDEGQLKYYLYYDFDDEEILYDWFYTEKYQGTICCINGKFKDIAIAEIGEDRLKNYLKEC